MAPKSCAICATLITGGLLVVIGIALVPVSHLMIYNRFIKNIFLTENSSAFDSWKNPPSPVYKEYYFFNVTNPEEFLAGGKASVKQVGPYTYRECRQWENVSFLENGTKVYAQNHKMFIFVPEKSVGDPKADIVNTVNIPLVTTMELIKSFFLRTLISMYVRQLGLGLFMNPTVHELLWGFKDPLLTKLHQNNPKIHEHYGLMWEKNGTHEGEYIFYTGEQNYLDFGKIDTWNGLRKLSWWSSPFSNMINGTDGTLFHPLIEKHKLLYIFAPDLCRSVHLSFTDYVEFNGIQAYRFTPPSDVFMDPTLTNDSNCLPDGDCLGTGVLKVSNCQEGVPIVMSFPHFYQADPEYISAVDGLNPSKEKHELYLDLEPTTGALIRTCKRTQLNIMVKRFPGFAMMRHIKKTIFPIMYINEMTKINDDSAVQMRELQQTVSVVSMFPLLILGVGSFLVLVSIVLLCLCKRCTINSSSNNMGFAMVRTSVDQVTQ